MDSLVVKANQECRVLRSQYVGGLPASEDFWLYTNESAWKLKAPFARRQEAPFASNEVWFVPHLEIPAPGTARTLQFSNSRQGVLMRLCAISGPESRVTYSNGVLVRVSKSTRGPAGDDERTMFEMTADAPSVQLVLQIVGLTEELLFHAVARQNGRDSRCRVARSNGNYRLLFLDAPEESGWVDITFVIQRRRTINFLVRPPLPQ